MPVPSRYSSPISVLTVPAARNHRRHESEIAWLTRSIELLARLLYLLPSLAAALATPVSNLRLPDEDLVGRTGLEPATYRL